jgi:predicted phage terminase large subunit-like protein
MTFASQVRFLLSENPYYSNNDLYRLTNAISIKEKDAVRKAKSTILSTTKHYKIRTKTPQKRPNVNDFFELVSIARPPYKTLYKWQYDLFNVMEDHDLVEIIVPRDHGKSVLLTFYIEYLLDIKKFDVLLLGWSDKVYRMANHVYQYFIMYDKITDEGIIKNTTNHFLTKDNIRFDCYGLREKAILGYHPEEYGEKRGLVIIVDDPIDESFEYYPAKERDIENRWESTIANINPTKLIISGTRKFEGDFLEYIAKRYEGRITIFHRTPYNEDGTLLCPERWTPEKLAIKRQEIGEYRYSSEYMGDPQPLTGGVWIPEDIHYITNIKRWSEYDMCIVSTDPAWTQTEDSDYTAIEVMFREKATKNYIVFDDISGKFSFDDILKRMEELYADIKHHFKTIPIIFAIEANGGGQILIDLARSRHLNFQSYILEVKHNRAKEERIMTLEVPIKNGSIQFLNELEESELIREILTFPNCRKYDSIDALSMAFIEIEKLSPRNLIIMRKKWY